MQEMQYMLQRGRLRHGARRRGSVLSSVLIAVSITGAFVVTAMHFGPAYLHGQSQPQEPIPAQVERHQQIIELIAGIVGASSQVLRIHPRGRTPYCEVVLRIAGEGDPIEPDQIALLSHSRVLQTVTLFVNKDPHFPVSEYDIAGPDFPDVWRVDPHVKPRVLATGISDMRIDSPVPGMLQIALTWAADSADGEDSASVFIQLPDGSFQTPSD